MKETETYVAQTIRATDNNLQSDAACKKVLSDKEILAHILKGVVPEYNDCTLEEIIKYIEPDGVQVSVPVAPGLTNRRENISGMATESIILNEATVDFDVKFSALLPGESGTTAQVCLYFNIESQKEYRPGYPIEKRGIYYLSRMISSQLEKISRDTDYSILQKVYSIWVCLGRGIPKNEQLTISKYAMKKQDIHGCTTDNRDNYDLMSLIMIRLGDGETDEQTIGMLQTLLWKKMPLTERLEALEAKFGIHMTHELEEEVSNMCTYSQAVEERGMEKGMEKGINIYKMLLLTKSVRETANRLGETEESIRKIALENEIQIVD